MFYWARGERGAKADGIRDLVWRSDLSKEKAASDVGFFFPGIFSSSPFDVHVEARLRVAKSVELCDYVSKTTGKIAWMDLDTRQRTKRVFSRPSACAISASSLL